MPTQAVSVKSAEHYKWGGASGNDCDGWHLAKTPELSVIEELMPSGTSEVRHYHVRSRQFFYVLEGELAIDVEYHEFVLKVGEGVEIVPGQQHKAVKRSVRPVRILVISQPPSHGDRILV